MHEITAETSEPCPPLAASAAHPVRCRSGSSALRRTLFGYAAWSISLGRCRLPNSSDPAGWANAGQIPRSRRDHPHQRLSRSDSTSSTPRRMDRPSRAGQEIIDPPSPRLQDRSPQHRSIIPSRLDGTEADGLRKRGSAAGLGPGHAFAADRRRSARCDARFDLKGGRMPLLALWPRASISTMRARCATVCAHVRSSAWQK